MLYLPTELWEQTFAYLEGPMPIDKWWDYGDQYDASSLKDLASLALVCRTFHPIARQLLYRTILAEGFDDGEDFKLRDKRKRLLARSLTDNPRLATYTRNICFDGSYEEQAGIDAVLDREDVGEREKEWLRLTLMGKSETRWNAQLLALMRNLQIVDVSVYQDAFEIAAMLSGRSDVEKLMQAVADLRETGQFMYSEREEEAKLLSEIPSALDNETVSDNALPHLKEIRFRHGDCSDGSISIVDIEAVLLHPGLERLHLLGFDWTSLSLRKARWALHPNSALQLLELRECFIDAPGLRNVLTRFENLHTLHIILGDSRRDNPSFDTDREQYDWELDLTAVGAVLREHGRNLVSFELHTTDFNSYGSSEGRIGSLKQMTALRHLRIVECELTGYRARYESTEYNPLPLEDTLPLGLETLYLHYDDHYFGPCSPDQMLFDILGRTLRSGRFPDLREIKVERFLDDSTKTLKPEIEGWEVRMTEVHLWQRPTSSGCMRLVIELTRLDT